MSAERDSKKFVRDSYQTVDKYVDMWSEGGKDKGNSTTDDSGTVAERKEKYTALVNMYYDLATDFYEWAWGTSFHFAPRRNGESVAASIARHEHFLALRMGLKPGMKIADIGCGVGGPMMEIARFSGAEVVGINNNAYQVFRGEKHIKAAGLNGLCSFRKADFMHIPYEDESFDGCYAFEAICHAPDKVGIYTELMRILKPGSYLACYEWCLTDKFDRSNPEHRQLKEDIEVGDGLPDIDSTADVLNALRKTGFEIIEAEDVAQPTPINPIPWYEPLSPSFSLSGIKLTNFGVSLTHTSLNVLEKVGLLTKGTTQTHSVLMRAQTGLLAGGKNGSFTPMYYFLARKPLNKKK